MDSLTSSSFQALAIYLFLSNCLIVGVCQRVVLERINHLFYWLTRHLLPLLLSLLMLTCVQGFLLALFNRYWPVYTVIMFFTYVIASVDHIKYENALTHFLWSDLFKTSDAGKFSELIGHYIRPAVFVPIIGLLGLGNWLIISVLDKPFTSGLPGILPRMLVAAGSLVLFTGFLRYADWANSRFNRRFKLIPPLNSYNFDQNVRSHGVLLGFLAHSRLVANEQDRPDDYNLATAYNVCSTLNQAVGGFVVQPSPAEKLKPYKRCAIQSDHQATTQPTLIVLAVEAFWDVTRIPGLTFKEDPFAAFRADLQGNVLASCFAGSTANTEFEFLTSLSMKNLHDSACPFIHVAHGLKGLPAHLQSIGYQTTAIHSYSRSFYDRDRVYPMLGFDQFWGLEDLKAAGFGYEKGFYMADESLIDPIRHQLNATTDPQLIYTLTMQNHGPYSPARYTADELNPQSTPDFADFLRINPGEKQAIVNYSQGLRDVGKLYMAIKNLVRSIDRPVWVLTFGDHLPGLGDQSGYRLMLKSGLAQTVQDAALFSVPWCLWANSEAQLTGLNLESQPVDPLITFNELAPQLLNAAHLPLRARHQLVLELHRQQNSPAESSAELLEAYKWLQYDWLWGDHMIREI